jgi:type VI secretion system secreted protein Hcp
MAFSAALLFTLPSASGIPAPQGESLIVPNGIELGDSWNFSLENKLDISHRTTGAGAGKAEFQEFTVKKSVDKASSLLFLACGAGATYDNVELILRKSTGNQANSGINYLQWTFNMFAVEKIEWSYGDPFCEENVTFKFGACQIQYYQQHGNTNQLTKVTPQMWSQVVNASSMSVGI